MPDPRPPRRPAAGRAPRAGPEPRPRGPLCTMVLGDLGADVIKVERPGSGDDTRQWGPPWAGDESAYFLCVNRNKRSVAADLKSGRGRRSCAALRAARTWWWRTSRRGCWRGGASATTTSPRQPRLVFCSITGYGSGGPEAGRPGYDFAVQARAGWMAITGEPEGRAVQGGGGGGGRADGAERGRRRARRAARARPQRARAAGGGVAAGTRRWRGWRT
jgi:hypothetical protein